VNADDVTLQRAWQLAFRSDTPEGRGELESLLPALVAAGYVETGETAWGFTPAGIARINELQPDDADA
jgi:hypothetical protein